MKQNCQHIYPMTSEAKRLLARKGCYDAPKHPLVSGVRASYFLDDTPITPATRERLVKAWQGLKKPARKGNA